MSKQESTSDDGKQIKIDAAIERLIACYDTGGKLMICGNGGSAADCEHIVGELMKGFCLPRSLSSGDRDQVRDLDINIGILTHPTIREADGLALSSRNQYLTTAQRLLAPKIYAQMQHTSARINNGTDINTAIYQAKDQLQKAGFGKIDYFDLRQPDDFQPCDKPTATSRVFVAIWLGSTRLIDNCAIG